jgi:hypothetical protein
MAVCLEDLYAKRKAEVREDRRRGESNATRRTWTHFQFCSQFQHLMLMSSDPVNTKGSVGWTLRVRM